MDDYEYGIPDPDYGVFGDKDCPPMPPRPVSKRNPKLDEEDRVSRNFNLYMIELYNKAVK